MLRLILTLAMTLCVCAAAPTNRARVIDNHASYPEGPLWRDGKLYVAEMGADRVSVFENGRKRTFFHRSGCGPTALAPYGDGFLVLCHIEGAVVAVGAGGQARFVRTEDNEGRAFRDPNDCFEDGRGGVYFSDPGLFSRVTRPHGALVHIDAQGVVTRVADELWYPNGVYVDLAHRTLYLSETFRRRVLRYPLNDDGSVAAPSVFFDVSNTPPDRLDPPYREAGPDGLEMDPAGNLYVAIYGEARILKISPAGVYQGQLDEPARYVTNITFDPQGNAYTVGSFDNDTPPFPGQVRFRPAAMLAAVGR
ncbi:MAG: SMP-30/gluconolactonase/LRE family protein [Caulobacterales bacterium]